MKKTNVFAVLVLLFLLAMVAILFLGVALLQKEKENIRLKKEINELITYKPNAAFKKTLSQIHIQTKNNYLLPFDRVITVVIDKNIFDLKYGSTQFALNIYPCQDMFPANQSGILTTEFDPVSMRAFFVSWDKYYPSETYPLGEFKVSEDFLGTYKIYLNKTIVEKISKKFRLEFIKRKGQPG